MDRDSQVAAIEKTFADSKMAIEKHYSKPNITPVEILPMYPDFKVSIVVAPSVCVTHALIPTGVEIRLRPSHFRLGSSSGRKICTCPNRRNVSSYDQVKLRFQF